MYQKAILSEMAKLKGGAAGMLKDLTAGRVLEDPFPKDATARLKCVLIKEADLDIMKLEPPGKEADQPINVRLMGGLLRRLGDPDAEIFTTYRSGVPIGVGVDLPRTPMVFPEKTSWKYKEQDTGGGI